MSFHDAIWRISVALSVPLVIAAVAAGCGSSGGSSVAHPSQSASTGSSQQAITSAFVTFFSGKTDASTKIRLLQNGSQFADAIKAQAESGLAKSSSVKIDKVTVTSADSATVEYTVLLAGQPALKDQMGAAVRVSGTWKVSASTFCALLTLEGQAPAACPTPSASSASG